MDSANVRRKDTTKGPPLRVLSLDGGGVRGYSMLIILSELMYRAYVETEGKPPRHEDIPKPCEYFDLIGGTGTGGLIAIMLGRLRLDLDTCMDVYARMTKRVFETDKTIAGIPYKSTLFKASKLEDAIRACVREHTVYEDEGNDGTARGGREFDGMSPVSPSGMRRSASIRSNSTLGLSSPAGTTRNSMVQPSFMQWGNPEASLYDDRENRTKTAVTAVYKGTNPKTGSSILLRSYDSRKESAPESHCTIWQAGRATSATGLAFKPIQIGQSVFIDEGAGKYNPSPQLLEEAAVNEWPGREIGVFVSIGTGKRPSGTNSQQHEWWEGFVGGSMGSFAEARRRLIAKIEGCEDTHIQMMNMELPKRGVPVENYCRLNVEVGVGEFGMNEWDRLSEMTVNTRRYLGTPDTQQRLESAAYKMAKIELMKRRWDATSDHKREPSWSSMQREQIQHRPISASASHPDAIELPAGDVVPLQSTSQDYRIPPRSLPYPDGQATTSQDKFVVLPGDLPQPARPAELPHKSSNQRFSYSLSPSEPTQHLRLDYSSVHPDAPPPPIPPKTPINDTAPSHHHPTHHSSPTRRSPPTRSINISSRLPYPDDGPPPVVSKLRKPEFTQR